MKIKVEKTTGAYVNSFSHTYKLVDSIMKTHFKELMRVSTYNAKEKTGIVSKRNTVKFLALVEKIEKSNSDQARKSHQKTAEAAKNRGYKSDISFEDYCEDFIDQDPALMSPDQLREAREGFRNLNK